MRTSCQSNSSLQLPFATFVTSINAFRDTFRLGYRRLFGVVGVLVQSVDENVGVWTLQSRLFILDRMAGAME
jgi:hypothetical protein